MSSKTGRDRAPIIAPPPLITLAYALAGWGLHMLLPARILDRSIALPVGIGLCFAAVALVLWAVFAFKAEGTNVSPHKPTVKIVRRGPYRFSRNPMYISLCLMMLGIGFVFNSWILLLMTIPLFLTLHFGVVRREEKYLESKFGGEYLVLKSGVRRWI